MHKEEILKCIDQYNNRKPSIVDISVHKHTEYANNLLITEASFKDSDLCFIAYSIKHEFPFLIGNDEEVFSEYIKAINPKKISLDDFLRVFKTQILDKAIAHRLDVTELESVYELLEADNEEYDIWYFVKTKRKRYCIFFDYCD